MAITAVQFLSPVGMIEADTMFPGEDAGVILTRIESAIEEAVSKTVDVAPENADLAMAAWTYYRLWMAVYISLSATPSSAAMTDMGSTLYTYQQIQNFKDLADAALKEFLGYTELAGTFRPQPQSHSVLHKIVY